MKLLKQGFKLKVWVFLLCLLLSFCDLRLSVVKLTYFTVLFMPVELVA